ncbi:TolC family protein [Lacinutrix algicola]|uniref:TolC family protein n=1 Tax=Lacinutrix algicola TaxID=342954 RepID=UPI0006E2D253|nr:TolC family protein [Lacinutrix algicola]
MRKLLILFSLIISTITYSQDTKTEFTLQEAIDYALENNRQSKNAALDIDAAIKQKWETTATGLPQISATVDYQNALKRNVFVFGDEIIQAGSKHTLTGTATLSQLLFDGSYLVGLQSAKVYLEISKNAKIKTDLEVRKSVINAYGNVLLAKESVSILERNIAVLEKNLNDITKIFENGLEEEESVEQLKITLSSVKSNLNNTTRLKNLAHQMLNITIGKPINESIIVTEDLDALAVENIQLELLDTANNAENTIDYKIAVNDKVSKELLVKLEKSKALPRLSAFVNGGYSGNRESFNFTNTDEKWYGSSIFGVSLNVPIFSSGMRSAATQRAQINLEKSKINLTETEQVLNLQIQSAKSDYQFAIEDYQNKKENLALAERIENKNQIKFFEGISSSFDLRQAQTQLYTAQQELLQTMLDVITKKAELETLLNTTI